MNPIRTAALALTFAVFACSPDAGQPDAGADTTPDAEAADTGVQEARGPDDSSVSTAAAECWLRDATFEEAVARASPRAVVVMPMGDESATLCYGRPSARGRTVMGELVPYGEPWRLGADEATSIHLPFPATIGNLDVEPGVYSLFVVPGEDSWDIVVNRSWQRWGIGIGPDVRAEDVGSFPVGVRTSDDVVEVFTMTWEPRDESSGNLAMEWEGTRVEIPVTRREG
jgi:hypothetical protein